MLCWKMLVWGCGARSLFLSRFGFADDAIKKKLSLSERRDHGRRGVRVDVYLLALADVKKKEGERDEEKDDVYICTHEKECV